MPEIRFKKQHLGQWRRDDGETKTHVNWETMFLEISKLIEDGWKANVDGVTHIRVITVVKEQSHGVFPGSEGKKNQGREAS